MYPAGPSYTKTKQKPHPHKSVWNPKRLLDLGCGNGSVLMMNAWQYPEAECVGIEARKEGNYTPYTPTRAL